MMNEQFYTPVECDILKDEAFNCDCGYEYYNQAGDNDE